MERPHGHAALRRWGPWMLWGVLTVAIVLAVRRLPWPQVVDRLAGAHPEWMVAAVAANAAILPLWAAEWRLLVPTAFRVGYRRMFAIVAMTASVLNSIPFLAGEASAVGLLIARGNLSRAAAASVLALDQLLVAFVKLLTIAAAAALVPLPGSLNAGVAGLATGFALLLFTLLTLAHRWEELAGRVASGSGRSSRWFARALRVGLQLEALRDGRVVAVVAGIAIAKKAAELLGVVAVQVAFGLDPSVSTALLVLAGLAITTLLPVTPANLGVYEATVFAAYRYAGVPSDAALGMAVVQHACFAIPPLLIGYTVATASGLRRR